MFAEKVLEILPPLSHRNQPVAKSKAPSKNLGGMRDSSWAPPSMEHVRCLTGMQFPVPPSLPPSLLPLLRPQVKHFLPWEHTENLSPSPTHRCTPPPNWLGKLYPFLQISALWSHPTGKVSLSSLTRFHIFHVFLFHYTYRSSHLNLFAWFFDEYHHPCSMRQKS